MQWPRSQTQLGRCPFLGGLGVLVVLAASAMGKDVVVVAIGDAGTGQTRKTGIVQDYTGRQLTLRTTSGNELTIATDKVISLETERSEPQLAGDRLLAEDKFREALEAYDRAAGLDRRVWMRRQILAQMVWCLRGMQDIPRAGDTFLLILQSDPHTQYFAAMPLNWLDGQRPAGIAQRSNEWLTAEPPAARLLRVEGGWYAVVQVQETKSEEMLVLDLLEQEHVLVHPGYFFDFPKIFISKYQRAAAPLTPPYAAHKKVIIIRTNGRTYGQK